MRIGEKQLQWISGLERRAGDVGFPVPGKVVPKPEMCALERSIGHAIEPWPTRSNSSYRKYDEISHDAVYKISRTHQERQKRLVI